MGLNEQTIKVKGPHGELSQLIPKEISVSISDDTVTVSKNEETIKARQKYGLVRSLVNNMVIGVSEKFEKKMQMIGVGYRAQVQGKKLTLLVGYSHPVEFEVPDCPLFQQIEVCGELLPRVNFEALLRA